MRKVSGLWQYRHRRGHPLRKTVIRVPGPSTAVTSSQEWIEPSVAIAHPSQALRALKIRQLLEPADARTAQAGGRGQEVLVPTAVAHGRRGLRHDRSPCSRAQAWEWKVR